MLKKIICNIKLKYLNWNTSNYSNVTYTNTYIYYKRCKSESLL